MNPFPLFRAHIGRKLGLNGFVPYFLWLKHFNMVIQKVNSFAKNIVYLLCIKLTTER